jgi:hypothetical protein
MSRGSGATSLRSSSTASAASSTAATTPPGSPSTPTSRRHRLPARRTPGRPRSSSARRARSRTSCDPSTPVGASPPIRLISCSIRSFFPLREMCHGAKQRFFLFDEVRLSPLFHAVKLRFWSRSKFKIPYSNVTWFVLSRG